MDAVGLELDAKRVGHRLEAELRDGVRPEEGQRARPGDRPDEHDPAARRPDGGRQRLGHRELADDVHLELAAELVERQVLERRGDRDAGVVDEPVQTLADRLPRAAIASASVTSRISSVVPAGAAPCSRTPAKTFQPPRASRPRRPRRCPKRRQ